MPTTRNGSSGASLAASRIVSSPCSGISLPTKSACVNAPDEPGRKTRSSAPTKQTSTRSRSASSARKRACCSVSATTTSAARSARRSTSESARAGKRAGPEARAVGDERVRERDERVEEHGRAASRALRRGQVEVAGVADDHGVVALARPTEQAKLRAREPQRRRRARAPRVARSLPHGLVPLDDLDACAAQARDHLRVARVVALVRSEVEDLQERISSTCSSSRPRSSARSSWCVVIISPISPSERNCIPTTTSSTPSVSSGRCPIALPLSQSTVR